MNLQMGAEGECFALCMLMSMGVQVPCCIHAHRDIFTHQSLHVIFAMAVKAMSSGCWYGVAPLNVLFKWLVSEPSTGKKSATVWKTFIADISENSIYVKWFWI